MAKFKFKAITPEGVTVTGVEDALSVGMARRALLERSLSPLDVQEKKSLLQLEITKEKVPRRELMHFSRQMAVFMRAGIPVLEALEVMTQEMANKVFASVLAQMADSLREGSTFAGAAAMHPKAFPPYYLGILGSAELTGNIDVVLDQLADYIERDIEARRKVSSALMYPAIVFVFAIIAVVIITAFVLPRFKTFFNSLHAKLPLPTRMLIAIANFFANDWYVVVAVIAVLVALAVVGFTTPKGRELRDRLFMQIPVLGDLIRTAVLERFCRILHSMVEAGVPLPDALQVTSGTTTNYVYRTGLAEARTEMMQGKGLAGPLAQTGLFPPAARHMFLVGENTGTMDEQLHSAAIYFDRELDYKLKRFTALFEPAVIVFVGVVVGFVAIALISAMYGIYRQVHIT
ncbi:MAG TPA: type II secretion system F family protein [Acidimicrobiaceae bacterium]|nr:type II secretion system F family protein [Acidimicrobiaceae bacterium]